MSAAQSTGVTSTDRIRTSFPALERVHNGYPVAYFDGPGGTQVPRQVVEAMSDYLYHHNANTHWAYPTSEETDQAIEAAREACADFLNATPNEIAFGNNMTTLAFHLSRALLSKFERDDEIVVTELDHHANIAPWRRLARERGLTVRSVRMVPETGQLDWDDFERSVGKQTKLIAIGAASNALGTINDIPRAVRIARQLGALIFVDAVHYAPHELVDVKAWDCDFLALSAYKFYGPHVGILYGKHDLLAALDFPKLIPAPDYPPENVETGTQNQEGMVGAGAAIDFLADLSGGVSRRQNLSQAFEQLRARNVTLLSALWNGLATIPRVRLYGPTPAEARTPTLSFTVDGVTSTTVAKRLSAKGLFLSHGDFYAATVVERLGLAEEGLVRAGCACYTTEDEIDRLINAVSELAEF